MCSWSNLLAMQMPRKNHARDWVWKLNKTLYGAKQSPREARAVLVKEFTRLKLKLMKSEPNVYFIRRGEEVMVLVNFFDNTLVAWCHKEQILEA